MYTRFLKRGLDIILSALGLAVCIVPMLVVALVIKIDSRGPVLFRQKRVGIHKTHFTVLKFRSMPMDAPHDTPTHQLETAEDMLSPWQRFIRKTSIDELPQLWCIFIGTMSIIGPRPALWNQYDLIAERDKYGANDIRPGLTGWAQINGRDEVDIFTKAKLDGEYVKHMSFIFDCRCFLKTIGKVFRRDGVVEGGVQKRIAENREQEEAKA